MTEPTFEVADPCGQGIVGPCHQMDCPDCRRRTPERVGVVGSRYWGVCDSCAFTTGEWASRTTAATKLRDHLIDLHGIEDGVIQVD